MRRSTAHGTTGASIRLRPNNSIFVQESLNSVNPIIKKRKKLRHQLARETNGATKPSFGHLKQDSVAKMWKPHQQSSSWEEKTRWSFTVRHNLKQWKHVVYCIIGTVGW